MPPPHEIEARIRQHPWAAKILDAKQLAAGESLDFSGYVSIVAEVAGMVDEVEAAGLTGQDLVAITSYLEGLGSGASLQGLRSILAGYTTIDTGTGTGTGTDTGTDTGTGTGTGTGSSSLDTFDSVIANAGISPRYAEQSPSTAFTRYLATQPGLPGIGTSARGAIEDRGRFLADLAPAFKYGIGQELGGQGVDFMPFFQQFGGGQTPSFEDTSSQLRGALTDVRNLNPQVLDDFNFEVGRMMEEEGLSSDDAQLQVAQQLGIDDPSGFIRGATFANQGEQADSVLANLALRVNPYFRSGLEGAVSNAFRMQRAVSPTQNFLQYALTRGWI